MKVRDHGNSTGEHRLTDSYADFAAAGQDGFALVTPCYIRKGCKLKDSKLVD